MTNGHRTDKLLFVHTPKTAGSHTGEYIRTQLGYPVIASRKKDENGVWVDFTLEELHDHIGAEGGMLMAHTLAFGWDALAYSIPPVTKEEVVSALRAFRARGWFAFTFVRHPGDLLCSFYHYVYGYHEQGKKVVVDKHCPVVDRTIDEFVVEHCNRELLPAYWGEFDFVAEASDDSFKLFYWRFFNHDFQPGVAPVHKSGNKGYAHYCGRGLISPETQARVEASRSMAIYRDIIADFR